MKKLVLTLFVVVFFVPISFADYGFVGVTDCLLQSMSVPIRISHDQTESQYVIPAADLAAVFTETRLITEMGWYRCAGDIYAADTVIQVWLEMMPTPCDREVCLPPDGSHRPNPNVTGSASLIYAGPLADCVAPAFCVFVLDDPFTYSPGNCLVVTVCETQEGGSDLGGWGMMSDVPNGLARYDNTINFNCDITDDQGDYTSCTWGWTTTCFTHESLVTPTPTATPVVDVPATGPFGLGILILLISGIIGCATFKRKN
ncbi:hypothetical protein K8T06_01715 [bacterium]|nr:hypothetical protein [bacterium]